jgi:hyaluronan synthase
MGLTLGYLLLGRLELTPHGAAIAAAWLLVGRGIRGYSHLRRHPSEIFLLPLYSLVVIFVALPIKAYALLTMNKQGWLTRTAQQIGGEGQTATTLVHDAA